MGKYDEDTKQRIRALRGEGLTHTEIQAKLGVTVPKGSMNYLCRGITLSDQQKRRISELVKANSSVARQQAVIANRLLFDIRILEYQQANVGLDEFMQDRKSQIVALAMLYLGEGAKWPASRGLKLGSSDPNIIRLYINLLQACYGVPLEKLKGRVQHRADQDPAKLVSFWSEVTGIKSSNFYPSYVDKRSIGKPTQNATHKGVCTIHSAGTHIQLELSEVSAIISRSIARGIGAVGSAPQWH
jgi:hypothetical protein